MKISNMNYFSLPDVANLEKECFSHPWTEESLEESLGNPNSYFFVATDAEDKTIGYIGTYIVRDEAYVTNVAVTESERGRGVGRALVERAVENARACNASFISLEVRLSNAAAVSLYKSVGFESVGVRPNFYRDPDEDALIMTLYFNRGIF